MITFWCIYGIGACFYGILMQFLMWRDGQSFGFKEYAGLAIQMWVWPVCLWRYRKEFFK